MIIPARFGGPPGAANGGVVAATLAGFGPGDVTIRRPVPVETPLTVRAALSVIQDASGAPLAVARATWIPLSG